MGKATFKYTLMAIAMLLIANPLYASRGVHGPSSNGLTGIYSGKSTYYRFPGPTASRGHQMIGAVGTNGNGYFLSIPATSSLQVFQDLRHDGEITSAEHDVPTDARGVTRGARMWRFTARSAGSSGRPYELHGKFQSVDGYSTVRLRMLPLTHMSVVLNQRTGRYGGYNISRDTRVEITLSPGGKFTGTYAKGCRISGILTQVGHLNLFDTDMTLGGRVGCDGAMRGIAFFDTTDQTNRSSRTKGDYLYLIGANRNFSHGLAMVLSYRDQ